MNDDFDICLHCKHYKKEYFKGRLIADCCNIGSRNVHQTLQCRFFSRTLKSKLGLVKWMNLDTFHNQLSIMLLMVMGKGYKSTEVEVMITKSSGKTLFCVRGGEEVVDYFEVI